MSAVCHKKVESCCQCGQGFTDDTEDSGKSDQAVLVGGYWLGCGAHWQVQEKDAWPHEFVPPATADSRVRVTLIEQSESSDVRQADAKCECITLLACTY